MGQAQVRSTEELLIGHGGLQGEWRTGYSEQGEERVDEGPWELGTGALRWERSCGRRQAGAGCPVQGVEFSPSAGREPWMTGKARE